MVLHKALYWSAGTNSIICNLCPNNCTLKNGQTGPCHTRTNRDGQLYTLAYNNPSAMHIDPVEKKPLYHFRPGHKTFSLATNGCVLHCMQCQNSSISQCSPTHTPDAFFSPQEMVYKAKLNHCESLSLTYTDPIAYYEYALDIANAAKKDNLPVLFISSGYINPKPLMTLSPFLTAANIDLKAFNDKTYKTVFKGSLHPVLDSIIQLINDKVWLEITCLIIPGINDSEDELMQMLEWMVNHNLQNVPIHFSRFFPSYKLNKLPPTPLSTLRNVKEKARQMGINYCYPGNISPSDGNNTYCKNCGTLLVDRHEGILPVCYILNNKCPECKATIPGIW